MRCGFQRALLLLLKK
ncbi:hypothetical protein HN014_20575 [Aquimarina sp. TRL1]|nr:hypothetical protein HN014_20575 [Aquimarina sp. TRL1]